MPSPKIITNIHVHPDELHQIVLALNSVTFTDQYAKQIELRDRLTRKLRKLWPEAYEKGRDKGNIATPSPATYRKRMA